MNKIYSFAIIASASLFFSCSKDILKSFDERIVGTWRITDVNRLGFGGGSEVRFSSGTFEFGSDGTLNYTDDSGNIYNGTWDIQRRSVEGNTVRTLQITAVDFNSQRVTGEFYDEMNFRGTNHFVAKINSPLRTLVTHFRR